MVEAHIAVAHNLAPSFVAAFAVLAHKSGHKTIAARLDRQFDSRFAGALHHRHFAGHNSCSVKAHTNHFALDRHHEIACDRHDFGGVDVADGVARGHDLDARHVIPLVLRGAHDWNGDGDRLNDSAVRHKSDHGIGYILRSGN